MLNKLFSLFSQDLGIDLGTANTLVYVRGRGIIVNQPSVVAVNKKTGQILAVGDEARRMIGKTPLHIAAIRPLIQGVISDFEVAEQMIRYFIKEVHKGNFASLARPRVVAGIPSGVTEVEKKAVIDATLSAGAREVYLVEEPMAAAVGARLPIRESTGSMIVDVGGGTTEVAVISLGGIVLSKSLRVAGDKMDEDIMNFCRDEFGLLIGERTAEDVKIKIGSASPRKEKPEIPVRGRDILTGLPKEIILDGDQARLAISRSVRIITEAVRGVVEETPPELIADIMNGGIMLSGGGGLLAGLDEILSEETQIPVKTIDDSLTAVVRGTGVILENLDDWKDILIVSSEG